MRHMMPRGGTLVVVAIAATICCAQAQAQRTKIVEITIAGNDAVERATILDAMPAEARVGQMVEDVPGLLAAIERKLMQLAYFEQVDAKSENTVGGVRLGVTVKERPRVTEVVFQGNTLINSDDLRAVVKTETGQFADKRLASRDAQRIVDAYADLTAAADVAYTHNAATGQMIFLVLEAVVGKVAFSGLHAVTAQEAATAASLESGKAVRLTEIEAAKRRLRDTGWFRAVDHSYKARREEDGHLTVDVTLDLAEREGIFPARVGPLRQDLKPEDLRALVEPPKLDLTVEAALSRSNTQEGMLSAPQSFEEKRAAAQAETAAPEAIRAYAEALRAAGEADEATREFDRALAMCRRSAEAAPQDPQPGIQLALTLQSLGRASEALQAAREACALGPDQIDAHVSFVMAGGDVVVEGFRGMMNAIVAGERKWDPAAPEFGALVELMPWEKTRQALAEAYGVPAPAADNQAAAIAREVRAHVTRAREMAPEDPVSLFMELRAVQLVLDAVLANLTPPDAALTALGEDREALVAGASPKALDDPAVALWLALLSAPRSMLVLGSPSNAAAFGETLAQERAKLLSELGRIVEKWPLAMNLAGKFLGIGQLLAGDFETARKSFEMVIAQTPHDRQAYNGLIGITTETQDWAGLQEIVRRRIQFSEKAEDHVLLGKTSALMGRDAEALEHFRNAASKFPEDPLGHLAVAGWLTHVGSDDAGAKAALARALELDPRSGYAYGVKCVLSLLEGKPDEATAALKTALEVAPEDALANSARRTLFGAFEG